VADTAFALELGRFIAPNLWPMRAQRSETALYFIDRSTLADRNATVRARRVVIPRETVHFTADYLAPDDRVTLHIGHPCASDASETIRPLDARFDGRIPRLDLAGLPTCPTDLGVFARYTIDVQSGSVAERELYRDERTWGPALFTQQGSTPQDQHQHLYWITMGFTRETLLSRVVRAYRDYPHRTVDPREQIARTKGPPTSHDQCLRTQRNNFSAKLSGMAEGRPNRESQDFCQGPHRHYGPAPTALGLASKSPAYGCCLRTVSIAWSAFSASTSLSV